MITYKLGYGIYLLYKTFTWEPELNTQYDQTIQEAVKQHLPEGYDWRLYKAQLWQESRLDPLAQSPAGALGLAQVVRPTWTMWAPKAGFKGARRTDPIASIHVGAVYLNYLIEEWSWPRPTADRYCLAMASYNAGLGHLLKAQKLMGNATSYAEIIKGLPQVTGRKSRETIHYVGVILDFCSDQIIGDM